MTDRQFAALKERVERLVDDPEERRKLLLQALNASLAEHRTYKQRHLRALERIHRRSQGLQFLIDGIAELRPDIQDPESIPMGHLIALVEPTHPDLAQQLREHVGL